MSQPTFEDQLKDPELTVPDDVERMPDEQPQYGDYFGYEEIHEFVMPDGLQKIFFKRMNEGDKALFQKRTNSDVVLEKKSGDARMTIDQGAQRHALIQIAVCGWSLVAKNPRTGGYEPVKYNDAPGGTFQQWLQKADPRIVEKLEKAIRDENPWLTADMTVTDIDEQIADLMKLREEVQKRDSLD